MERRKPAFGVGSPVNYPPYLCPRDSAGTHEARLHSDIKSASRQVFTAESATRRSNRLNLGMSGDIIECFSEIVATPYNSAFRTYYHGSDRHFFHFSGFAGLVKSHSHKAAVIALLLRGKPGFVGLHILFRNLCR